MTPLLIVLPFHNGDAELAKRLLTWINELDNRPTLSPFSILLAADSAVPIEMCKDIGALARKAFRNVEPLTVRVEARDWKAPNLMFHSVSKYIRDSYKFPFFWMEPDCVPLRPDWARVLAEEYHSQPRKFMGPLIPSSDTTLPALHMTGCSIYPADAFGLLEKHCNDGAANAWDISSAADVVVPGRARDTKSIHHLWGQKDLPPTFVAQKEQGKEYPVNTVDISIIPETAVIFHRCKDGTLIQVLREIRERTSQKKEEQKGGKVEVKK